MAQETDRFTKPYATSYRWVMLALIWLLYGVFGLAMRSIAPLVAPMLKDLNMSFGEMGVILGIWQLVYIPVSIVAGIAMDRWGIRRTLFVGTLVLALSEGLRYFATGFGNLLPMVALFGIGGPLISVGSPKTISVWFRGRNRATAVGVYTTAPWLGGMFAVGATNSLIMPNVGFSWRWTFVIYGLVAAAAAVVWVIASRDTAPDESYVSASVRKTFSRMVHVRSIVIVLLAALLALLIDHGFSHWLPDMLEIRGFSAEAAGFVASIPLLTALPAVLLIPRFTHIHRRGHILILLGAGTAAALLLINFATSDLMLISGLVLYGLSVPCMIPMLMLLLMDNPYVGPEYMGLAGGLFFAVAEIGGFSGPLIMGSMVDWTGGFTAGMSFLAGMSLLLAVLGVLLTRIKSEI